MRKINIKTDTDIVLTITDGDTTYLYSIDGEFILDALKTHIDLNCDITYKTNRMIKIKK